VLVFIVRNILELRNSLLLFSFHLFGGGDIVAHDLAHWQLTSLEQRVWIDDAPDEIGSRASDDIYVFIEAYSI